MASGQEYATGCPVLADNVRGGGRGKNTILSNDELGNTVGGTNFEYNLDCLWRIVATVSSNNNGGSLRVNGIKDSLNEVLGVVLHDVMRSYMGKSIMIALPPVGKP